MLKTTLAALAVASMLAPALSLAGGPQIDFNSGVADAINHEVAKPTIYAPQVNDAINDIILGDQSGGGSQPGYHNGGGVQLNATLKFGAALKCVVAGTPSEFPNDLRIRNAALASIPAGTVIKWTLSSPAAKGQVTLAHTLAPGQTLKVNGVLGSGVEAGTLCTAKAIGL